VLTFLLVLVVFSVLIIVHELGHMFAAKRLGVKVEKFSLGFGKRLFGVTKGGTEYAVSVVPLGGYVKMAGDNAAEAKGAPDEFLSKSVFKRFLIIIAGSVTNYIFAFLLFVLVFAIGFPTATSRVGKILPDYPAATSGLREGDLILEVQDKKVEYWPDLVAIVEKGTTGVPLLMKVERGGKTVKLEIVPKVVSGKNIFGQEMTVGKIGILPDSNVVLIKHDIRDSVVLGGQKLLELTGLTYKGLWFIVTGGMPIKDAVSGPVGIAVHIGQAAKAGIVALLFTMAYISMALAVFNLLPIPVLDGGHVLFLIIEKLKGKPVSAKTQDTISQVVLYLLVAFLLFVSWNDAQRWIIPIFKK